MRDESSAGDARTYELYDQLPPLPLPTLEETCARYLASVEPLVDAEAFARVKAKVDALQAPDGLGRKLDAALRAKAGSAENWLSDWWDDVAYLAFSEPVLINSNFGISCDCRQPSDDPALRAAEVAARSIDFHVGLVNETIAPETAGKAKTPLDMTLFKRILGATRAPGRVKDEIIVHGPEICRHLLVGRRGRLYTVPVLDDDGRAVSVADLAAAFQAVIDHADAQPQTDAPMAVLTTERRPVWAMERERLLSDPTNAAALERIETALFAVYFDEDGYETFNATARAALMGKPGQRWMDKVFAYVVDARGRVSQHGEHSPADGMQFVTIFDHGCDRSQRGVFRALPAESARRKADLEPGPIEWAPAQETRAALASAIAHFDAKTNDVDIEVLHFDAFSKNKIKTFGVGPDSFVQMAYQLAYQRLHGRTPKTYESGQTRAFKLGRTETIRSASNESRAWAIAMDDASTPDARKMEMMRASWAAHGTRGKQAAMGQGCDRHLLGLALIAGEMGEPTPELLSEEVHTRGWELSTAQLPMNALLVNGFGPVCHGGYGIGYVIQADTVTCHISSHRSHPDTNSLRFAQAITQAMHDMAALAERAG